MVSQTIRPYEISLWTLQDSFITVLKPLESDFQGQIITPKISLKNDGTQTLTFSIPMYYRNEDGKLLENPLWYNTLNGNLLVNLRKVKVIFNKGEEGEGIYEFVIHKITESHSSGKLICEVEAEGLAFQELGKIGYKITLNYDEFLLDVEEDTTLLATLNYWAEKLFRNTNWTYSIQMDWSSYDGVIDLDNNGNIINYENLTQEEKDNLNNRRENKPNCLRRRDKIYEEEYVSSWEDSNGKLVPREIVQFQEKARIPQIEKSNIYNATQDLAELFEVYCKYKYYYDDNYHIIGRECIFYNNFLDERIGKFDINYPYHTNEITRTLESADVITKMFVETTEDVSITQVAANRSKEDYILNFDYLYSIGTISQEQYNAVDEYIYQMHLLNSNYDAQYSKLAEIDLELIDLKAKYKNLLTSIAYDQEQIGKADEVLNSISDGTGILEKTDLAPLRVAIIEDTSSEDKGFKVNLSLEGIYPNLDDLGLYKKYSSSTGVDKNEASTIILKEENLIIDSDSGSLIGLKKLPVTESGLAFLVCKYSPKFKYETIKLTFTEKLAKDQAEFDLLKKRLDELGISYYEESFNIDIEGAYESLKKDLLNKQKEIKQAREAFEKMMGPALREGSWTPDEDYSKTGDRYSLAAFYIGYQEKLMRSFWDSELFDNELKHYYEENITLNKVYYPAINLNGIYNNNFIANASNLVLKIETDQISQNVTYLSIGSQLQYAFLKKASTIFPVLLITKSLAAQELVGLNTAEFGVLKIDKDGKRNFTLIAKLNEDSFLDGESYEIVYPRIEISSDKLKTSEDELVISQNGEELKKYSHYTLLTRDNNYYITIKPSVFINSQLIGKENLDQKADLLYVNNNKYDLNYVISNADLCLYLDALEVAKTNAYPQASYDVSVSILSTEVELSSNFLKFAYQKLNKVANINDSELKFENIQGYISEIEMNLDKPWEDSFTIQNYKTKFEDLFSRIVASSQQIQANQLAYDRAAASFTSGGILNPSIIQNTLNSIDLNYAFNQGTLTIDELNGIWGTSETGVVAFRGGGIFCATEKDALGNWIWTSGITPQGINASLLQAGVIDTNLVRIYSDDNIRFQMNGDGLFAYSENEDGSANFDKYIVYNNEGLFLTEKSEDTFNEQVNLVEVSWEGLTIRNKADDKVFYADDDGNLVIKGRLEVFSGATIAGWTIEENALTSNFTYADGDGQITAYSAGLASTKSIDDNVIWVGKEIDGMPAFRVKSDGTLYAANAFISGIISADTIVGGIEAGKIDSSLKKISIIPASEGNSFKYSNINLDNNIVVDPEWLRFLIVENNVKLDNWKFERWDRDSLEDETGQWVEIECASEPSSNTDLYFEDYNCLTFIAKYSIMNFKETENGEIVKHDFVYFKVSGSQIENNGELKEYETTFFLANKYVAVGRELSLFDPPSYTFIGSQKQPYEPFTTFKLTVKNLKPEDSNLIVDGEEIKGVTLLDGNSDIEDDTITREDSSTILVPEESLQNGQWFIDDVLVGTGSQISGNSDKMSITITKDELNNSAIIEFRVSSDLVPEGGQIMISYHLGAAVRTAFVFKIKNGTDVLSMQIVSSQGSIFKNGNIETELTANLYDGRLLLNETDNNTSITNYGYLWRSSDGRPLKNIDRVLENDEVIIDERIFLNKRTIKILEDDFEQKAIYTCEIYSGTEEKTGPQEAEEEYKRYYPDVIE